jgi:3-hydroxyisobutyrate dehydrogenase-like beta-hydroxyacid dehydrogenase
VSPETAAAIGREVEAAGAPFVDAGIVGPPPKDGETATRFYASGPRARDFAKLNEYGLDIRVLDDVVGTASALKLAYASLTKGFTALGAIAMLAAERAGISDALRAELAQSRPEFLRYLERQMPSMYGKSYRWVAEMEEISSFLSRDPAGAEIFRAMAELYRRIASDLDGPEVTALKKFASKGG